MYFTYNNHLLIRKYTNYIKVINFTLYQVNLHS